MPHEIHLLNCMHPDLVEAGCDEAGRGPLAGPVYAAAVILPKDFHHPLLNDSKQMTEKARETLRPIIEAEAVAWAVEAVSAEEIDRLYFANVSFHYINTLRNELTADLRNRKTVYSKSEIDQWMKKLFSCVNVSENVRLSHKRDVQRRFS